MTLISNPGLQQGDTDVRELYLKVFSGEVLTQWREKNVTRGLITLRTIPFGKSAQFPVLGKGYASVHTPGTNMLDTSGVTSRTSTDPTGSAIQLPNQFSHNERLIAIDNKLISSVMISDVDEMLNHYDVRSLYAMELANALANAFDRTAILSLIYAARIRSNNAQLVTGEPGGGYNGDGGCYGIGATPTGAAISDVLFKVAQRFDEIDLPKEGRICLLPPQAYYALIKDPNLYTLSTASSGTTGTFQRALSATAPAGITGGGAAFDNPNLRYGNADWARGMIASVAGIMIIPTNHIPTADLSGTTFYSALAGSNGNSYALNCSASRATALATQGICFHSSAVGCLMLKDLATESDYKAEYQSTLFLAKIMSGFSWLRPSSVIELTSVDKTTGA